MAVYHLRNFRLSPQTAWGTPATPATLMMGVTDGNVTVSVEDEVIEAIGWNVGNMALFKQRLTTGSWTQIATYEQIIYTLSGLLGVTTPTGSSAPYIWQYWLPAGNAVTPVVYTLDYVMQDVAYRVTDCLVSRATFRGEVNNALEIEAEFLSPNAPVSVSPATVSIPTTTIVNMFNATALIDAITVTPLVPLTGTVISFELTIDSGRHIKRFVGGPSFFGDTQWTIEGNVVLEFNAASRAIVESMFTTITQRMLRVFFRLDSSTSVDFYIPLTFTGDIELYGDRDGNAIVDLGFVGTYSSSFSTAFSCNVQNTISSL